MSDQVTMLDSGSELGFSQKLWNESDARFELAPYPADPSAKCLAVHFHTTMSGPGLKARFAVPQDWRAFGSLKFEVYSPLDYPKDICIRIEDASTKSYDDAFNLSFLYYLLPNGTTQIEVDIRELPAVNGRKLDRSAIRFLSLYVDSQSSDLALYFRNVRLDSSQAAPKPRLYWPLFEKIASPEVSRQFAQAKEALAGLRKRIEQVKAKGFDTIDVEIIPITADLTLEKRLVSAWEKDPTGVQIKNCQWILRACQQATTELDDIEAGRKKVLPVSPWIRANQTHLGKGGIYQGKRPVLYYSMNSLAGEFARGNHLELNPYFSPYNWAEESRGPGERLSLTGGVNRFGVDESPIMEAYQKHPDTHRVGEIEWCGQLIRDRMSFSVTGPEVILCLESPHLRDVVAKLLEESCRRIQEHKSFHLLETLGYEVEYYCYCDVSLRAFRDWLRERHGTIARANETLGTSYAGFEDITPPPPSQHASNPAIWWEWMKYNNRRFVDYAKWVGGVIHAILPEAKFITGSSGNELGGRLGIGYDNELVSRELNDATLQEGESTLLTELLRAYTGYRLPIVDPEHHDRQQAILPHFLHGLCVIDQWYWADPVPYEPNQPISFYESSVPVSWEIGAADVVRMLRASLDVRRFTDEIVAFQRAERPVKLLFSKSTQLQLPPAFVGAHHTPHGDELRRLYAGAKSCDAFVGVLTELNVVEQSLTDLQLLLVGGAAHVPAAVVAKLKSWVEKGGAMLLVPESFVGDEFGRPQDYLEQFGVQVKQVRRAETRDAGTVREAGGFAQNAMRQVAYDAKPRQIVLDRKLGGVKLTTVGTAEWDFSAKGKVLAKTADGQPAMMEIACKKGKVYVLGVQLDAQGYWLLVDWLMSQRQIDRPVRVLDAQGKKAASVESRTLKFKGKTLMYVFNDSEDERELRLGPSFKTQRIWDLRENRELVGLSFTILPKDTKFFRLEEAGAAAAHRSEASGSKTKRAKASGPKTKRKAARPKTSKPARGKGR